MEHIPNPSQEGSQADQNKKKKVQANEKNNTNPHNPADIL